MMFTTTTKSKIFASLFFFLKVNAFTINPPLGQRIRPVAPFTFTRSTTTSQLFVGEEMIGNVGVNSEGSGIKYDVSIEYCTGCKWMLRSAWLGQELLSTFEEDESLHSVTLVPRYVYILHLSLYILLSHKVLLLQFSIHYSILKAYLFIYLYVLISYFLL